MEEKQIIFLTDGAGTHEYSHAKKKKNCVPYHRPYTNIDQRPNIKSTSVKTLADFHLV